MRTEYYSLLKAAGFKHRTGGKNNSEGDIDGAYYVKIEENRYHNVSFFSGGYIIRDYDESNSKHSETILIALTTNYTIREPRDTTDLHRRFSNFLEFKKFFMEYFNQDLRKYKISIINGNV